MGCKYFTINARNKPEILLEKKLQNKRELLRFLKKDRATIYWGIKRLKGEYCAKKAQVNTNNKGDKKGRNLKIFFIN